MKVNFNKPYITGNEIKYIAKAVNKRTLSGNGEFSKKIQLFFKSKYGFNSSFVTTSCTDALEMSAILSNLNNKSEVIIPSYTFVSSANAFALRGSKIIFADSEKNTPNIDPLKIQELITNKTKAILVMHYGGIACDMDSIMKIAKKNNLLVIEDAAQSIDSYYKGKPLGSIGNFGTFSFHQTKNIVCGEGGLLSVNDNSFTERAEIIYEKGTNRSKFMRGEIDKYGWVDIGSSFLASEITSAFLLAQLEKIKIIQSKRLNTWNRYKNNLKDLSSHNKNILPNIPDYATNNAHVFYILCENFVERKNLIKFLNSNGVNASFHYSSLHNSEYFKNSYKGEKLIQAEKWSKCLLRLPLYADLENEKVDFVSSLILKFYNV